jgi:uncharacterized protein (TIGR02145 family)
MRLRSLEFHNDYSEILKGDKVMKRIFLILIAFTGLSFAVTGVAMNRENQALAGVEVQFVLDGSSTTTADDGSFTLMPKVTGVAASVSPAFEMNVADGTLHFMLPQASTGAIRTFDILGHLVHSSSVSLWAAGDNSYAPFGNNARFASGIYFIQYQFASRKGVLTMRIRSPGSSGITSNASVRTKTSTAVLRLESVTVLDSVRFSLSGFVTKTIPITDYSADLGTAILDSGCTNTYGKNIMTDCRDGQTYATIDIGYQTWMDQNLNYKPSKGTSWCYNNDDGYCSLYGRLYDWTTAMDTSATYKNTRLDDPVLHRGVCPYGWHVPTQPEWVNNPFEVTGMASGYWYGTFREADTSGHWWASTEGSGTTAYAALDSSTTFTAENKAYGYSLRCVMDSALPKQIKDARDGATYSTVAIGHQVWLSRNMSYQGFASDSVDTSTTEPKSYIKSTSYPSYSSETFYNYVAAQSVCPSGTHLPDTTEWAQLINYAGVWALESEGYWSAIAGCANCSGGTDKYGFGLRPIITDLDKVTGSYAYLWANNYDTTSKVGSYVYFDNRHSTRKGSSVWNSTYPVRCIVNRSSSSSNSFPFSSSSSSFSWNACVSNGQCGSFSDNRDNPATTYNWVKIGSQTWMASNLAYLPAVNNANDMSSTVAKYYVYGYQGDASSGPSVTAAKEKLSSTYGVLYNWVAAMAGSASSTASPSGVQGICPDGWHLPSLAEWDTLIVFVGGRDNAGRKLKATENWEWSSTNRNTYGFSAQPGGKHFGAFAFRGTDGFWWTATGLSTISAAAERAYYQETDLMEVDGNTDNGYSIRCVKNE